MITKNELIQIEQKAKYSGWERGKGAKLVLRLIKEIRQLQDKK